MKNAGTSKEFRGKNVFGILIADNKMKDTSIGSTLQALRHIMDTFTWEGLFNLVQSRYKEYLDILRMKAPDDPRIKGLVNLDEK